MTLTCKIVKTSGGTKKIFLMLSRYLKKQSVKYKSTDQKRLSYSCMAPPDKIILSYRIFISVVISSFLFNAT